MKKIIYTFLATSIALFAAGQAGELDLSFNGDGIYIQDLNGDARAEAMTLQPDGKILIAGRFDDGSGDDLYILRLDEFGNPDLTFGLQGYAIVDYKGDDETVESIVVDPNGSIYTLAVCDSANVVGALLSKFTSTGLLDNSFGIQGHLFVHKLSNSTTNTWNDLALGSDGNLLAVGRTNIAGSGLQGAVLKVSPQGQIVTSFGNSGVLLLQNNGANVNLSVVVPLPNDDAFIAGTTTQQGNLVAYLAKIDAGGNLVSTFGGNGIALISIPDVPFVRDVFVKPNGKIVVTASPYVNGWQNISVVQLESNGLLDQSFGTNGRSDTQILSGGTTANQTHMLPDGKLILTGTATGPWNDDFAIARLHSDGSLDMSFHFDGVSTKNIGGANDFVMASAMQADGRVVLVGNSQISGVGNSISVARFLTGYASAVDLVEEDAIKLIAYPNPFSDWLQIDAPEFIGDVKASMYSMHGQQMWVGMVSPNQKIDLKRAPNGMYVLTLQTSSGDIQNLKINVLH